ncbi:MAG: GNAT family N-acetyltransferase [Allosphingosinicella sp.]|uniref:GNAT family N-acetyltransferase n=1 Tax=Allosphingosinicella sp. TaxID=2823234 RepID=UPI0039396E7C
MQTGADIVRLFRHGAHSDCRMLPHGAIALSGAPAADLNMVFLTRGASAEECEQALDAVASKEVDTVLIIEEGAEDLRAWAAAKALTEVGQMPMMEREADDVRPITKLNVHIATPEEVGIGSRLAASAFALDKAACDIALAPGAFEIEGNDLWLAEDESGPVGCGIFVHSGDHVGIYTMSTPPEQQRRGIGRAILETAMAHYQDHGAERFTLGATEKGFPLYELVGFEVVTRPHVYVIGASTQFPAT